MTTAIAEPLIETSLARTETFAEIALRLGDIPLTRIIWLPRAATEEDAVRFCKAQRPVELIEGFLVEKAMGFRESLLAAALIMFLKNYTSPRKLGLVGAPDAMMRLRPGLIRLPDVSFISWPRLLAADAHTKTIAPLGPDLAVEILSEGNTSQEIDQKRRDFFASGTKLVWIIDPKARTAKVYDDPEHPNQMALIRETEVLHGGSVLPGFELALADLFADLDPPVS